MQPAAQSEVRRTWLRLAVLAAAITLIASLLPGSAGPEPIRDLVIVAATVIAVATLGRWTWLVHTAAARARRRLVPILFERRMTGRFRLRPKRSGREIEIWAGYQLAAEVNARPERDEIVIYPSVEIGEQELDEMGAALGQAILIAARADGQLAEPTAAGRSTGAHLPE